MVERIEQEPQGDGEQSDRSSATGPSQLDGWVRKEGEIDGMYIAAPLVDSATPDFSKFEKSSRARWDFLEFIKVKLQQLFKS